MTINVQKCCNTAHYVGTVVSDAALSAAER